ncbi:hypothetical protein [Limosilactobacillus fastidiosus]|uniref:Uncharacterized protein n=1 Tax=Limosilactobacillus fastidiosus TaxID=2759855 RepID=A0A7W3YCR3_9LACO|nr:hypothetical protein [Limosilactobacillus fastidiosus]MBB1086401.1 hypothetical protein [Limosilactobacillus fastidiosus]MCD7086224.1 hypothetical protein [Limosilactobacillus fastidiosus]MCD7114987.1 hypothetical protein [Limosilactobacillus fastidiosus]MCD7116850.1 hypothetical protein [Limosilactobacillus fastidiosus]
MDELTNQLNKMANGARKLEQKKSLSFSEVFIDSFVQKHTQFQSMDDFWKQAGIHSTEDFDAYSQEKLDAFTRKFSDAPTFQKLFDEAVNEYVSHQLGF